MRLQVDNFFENSGFWRAKAADTCTGRESTFEVVDSSQIDPLDTAQPFDLDTAQPFDSTMHAVVSVSLEERAARTRRDGQWRDHWQAQNLAARLVMLLAKPVLP